MRRVAHVIWIDIIVVPNFELRTHFGVDLLQFSNKIIPVMGFTEIVIPLQQTN